MNAKLATIVVCLMSAIAMVASGSDHEASVQRHVFALNRAPVFSIADVTNFIKDGAEPIEVARYLARTQNDGSYTFDGVKLSTLLSLNDYSLETDCTKDVIEERQRTCKQFVELKSLAKYCNHCLSQLVRACESNPRYVVEKSVDITELVELDRKINDYIQGTGVPIKEYSKRLFVIDYLHTVSQRERASLENFCNNTIETLEMHIGSMGSKIGQFLLTLSKQDSSLSEALFVCSYIKSGKYSDKTGLGNHSRA